MEERESAVFTSLTPPAGGVAYDKTGEHHQTPQQGGEWGAALLPITNQTLPWRGSHHFIEGRGVLTRSLLPEIVTTTSVEGDITSCFTSRTPPAGGVTCDKLQDTIRHPSKGGCKGGGWAPPRSPSPDPSQEGRASFQQGKEFYPVGPSDHQLPEGPPSGTPAKGVQGGGGLHFAPHHQILPGRGGLHFNRGRSSTLEVLPTINCPRALFSPGGHAEGGSRSGNKVITTATAQP